jgi:hypothetical protein
MRGQYHAKHGAGPRRSHLLACHQRSYNKGAQIEDPAHVRALTDEKHAARQHRGSPRT